MACSPTCCAASPGPGPPRVAAVLLVLLLAAATPAADHTREVYEQACASCHGADGRGASAGTAIAVPLPDFTDCVFATAESTANWVGLVREGGRFLGMSPQMPAFGEVLSDEEIRAVVAYVRGFCREPGYPIGDLNYRRPVFVEKAFPEDEAVAATAYESARHTRASATELSIEKRIGRRGQVEVALPSSVVDRDGRTAGVGDVALEYKHVLLAAPSWRTVVSGGLAVELPTGNRRHGVGAGTTLVTPQLFSAHAFGPLVAQTQVSGELPADPGRAPRRMRYRFALQYPLGPYKKNLVPALELEQTQALDTTVHGATLLGPTLYLPLSRRGHVALGVGSQLPVAGVRPFNWQLAAFLLWEYRDGPFWAW